MQKALTLIYSLALVLAQDNINGKLRISILDFQGDGVQSQILKFAYNRLESKLIESDRFEVLAKAEREEVLKEWEWQSASGACNEECAVEVGKLLNAQYLMVGSIVGSNNYYQINIKIVNIETGNIEDSDERVITGGVEQILDGMTEASREITRKITSSSGTRQIIQERSQLNITQVTYGSIDVNSIPEGANIFLDGIELGITPKIIPQIETGSHKLTLRYPGYETLTKGIMVEEGTTLAISEYLFVKTGSLSILSEPVGATVFIDGEVKGKTPLDLIDLPIKDYMVTVELDKYLKVEGRITVQYASNTTQKYELDPQPGKIRLFTDPVQADVIVKDKRYSTKEKYKSGAEGSLLVDLSVGEYKITITKKGYEPSDLNISIDPADILMKDITLKKLPSGISSNPDMGFLTVNTMDERTMLKISGIKEVQKLPMEYFELKYGQYGLKAFGPGLETKKSAVAIDRQKTTTIDIHLDFKSRPKALKYSLMFPGGGQFYAGSKSRNRGMIYAATALGTGVLLSKGLTNYFDDKNLLDQYQINYQNATLAEDIDASWTLYEQQSVMVNDAQTNMMILATTLASAWLTSIIDAYFFSGF